MLFLPSKCSCTSVLCDLGLNSTSGVDTASRVPYPKNSAWLRRRTQSLSVTRAALQCDNRKLFTCLNRLGNVTDNPGMTRNPTPRTSVDSRSRLALLQWDALP